MRRYLGIGNYLAGGELDPNVQRSGVYTYNYDEPDPKYRVTSGVSRQAMPAIVIGAALGIPFGPIGIVLGGIAGAIVGQRRTA